jgi:hypothetical protein
MVHRTGHVAPTTPERRDLTMKTKRLILIGVGTLIAGTNGWR